MMENVHPGKIVKIWPVRQFPFCRHPTTTTTKKCEIIIINNNKQKVKKTKTKKRMNNLNNNTRKKKNIHFGFVFFDEHLHTIINNREKIFQLIFSILVLMFFWCPSYFFLSHLHFSIYVLHLDCSKKNYNNNKTLRCVLLSRIDSKTKYKNIKIFTFRMKIVCLFV